MTEPSACFASLPGLERNLAPADSVTLTSARRSVAIAISCSSTLLLRESGDSSQRR